jgi:sulfide:quinone oxidoreductase
VAPRVVIAGCGVAALEAALALQARAGERVHVELVGPEARFRYRPLTVAEPFGLGEPASFDVAELAAAAGAGFTEASLLGVDVDAHQAATTVGAMAYEVLLVAIGAVPVAVVPGAQSFGTPGDGDLLRTTLDECVARNAGRLAFVVPGGSVWSLPAYELALMSARHLASRGASAVTVAVVTPEDAPLGLFGDVGSGAVRGLLDELGIEVHTGCHASEVSGGEIVITPGRTLPADAVVALPRLAGARIDGLPQTVDGFLPVDAHGRVVGLDDVLAAGDITSFPVKQGGIAAQQAMAAADAIAADAGADVVPQPFRPVLRGLLLTGAAPTYLRHERSGGSEHMQASSEPLWWPPAKIVGHYLAPFLAGMAGGAPHEVRAPQGAVGIEVELDPKTLETRRAPVFEPGAAGSPVAGVMQEPLVVAPEDTLGEVAERMRAADVGAAAVAEFGHLIGILTARDMLHAFAARAHPSEARVRPWMTAEPVTATVDTPTAQAAALMAQYGVNHLPVLDGETTVGMLDAEHVGHARPLAVGLGF